MPSKYNRKTRDRKGGHKTSLVTAASGSRYHCKTEATPTQRAEFKRITKKAARRQNTKAVKQALAWEDLADQRDEEEAKIDAWLASIDLADPYGDYFDYLQDQEDRLQDIHDDWFDYDESPHTLHHKADSLTSQARGYSHLAAGTVVTAADVGKTVFEVLQEAFFKDHANDERFALPA